MANFSNPNCYLSFTNSCSEKITGEHLISHNILHQVEPKKKAVLVSGYKWIEGNREIWVGKNSLVANCLCSKHNSELSELDAEAGRFFESIDIIERSKSTAGHLRHIKGVLLERWLLKSIIGMIFSGNADEKGDRERPLIRPKLFDLLVNPNARWPTNWGLYFSNEDGQAFHNNVAFTPTTDYSSGELMAVKAEIHGLKMSLVMGRAPPGYGFGVRRPRKLIFEGTDATSQITLGWGSRPGSQVMNYKQHCAFKIEFQ